MKKIITLILVIALIATAVVTLTACKKDSEDDFKIGLICLHGEQSTYDKNFIDAFKAAAKELGIPEKNVIIKTDVPEDNKCYDAAVDLVAQGCDFIFADSFDHETFLMQAAKEYPDVQFCHATGVRAHTAGIKNFHNAFASIYEGRYIAGVIAGMKLNEMIANEDITAEQAVMGYVAAKPFAEVKSGYTSFYLGAKSVCPSVTMKVQCTNSWYDEAMEKETANALMDAGCVLISQHADSMGAPSACELRNVPNVTYNLSTKASCGETYLCGSRINWVPYFKYAIKCAQEGKAIDTDWTGSIETGSVEILELGKNAPAGAADTIATLKQKFVDKQIKVFDTAEFTVRGVHLESAIADVDYDANYTPDTEVIINGVFEESTKRSAPYFYLDIDGISTLD